MTPVEEVESSPKPPPGWDLQDAQEQHNFPTSPLTTILDPPTPLVNDGPEPPTARSLEPAMANEALHSKIKQFIDGFEHAKPLLESTMTTAEIRDHLKTSRYTKDEQENTLRFLQFYRQGQAVLLL